jgi:hypothetical protein
MAEILTESGRLFRSCENWGSNLGCLYKGISRTIYLAGNFPSKSIRKKKSPKNILQKLLANNFPDEHFSYEYFTDQKFSNEEFSVQLQRRRSF